MIPGRGPNNQYLGLKDLLYISKTIGRTVGLPSFFLHSISGPESLRPFEKTFDKKYIEPYIKSISLEEYRKACSGVVDTLVWFYPDRSSWVHVVKFWMDGVRMKHLSEIETPHRILLMNKTEIVNMFTPLKEKKCIALCFLFRNVAETTERKAIATNLVYAKEIQDLARNAVKEIGTKPENMLSIHWRWGELSCAKWLSPDPRPDDDFCWGTSLFHYARSDDVLESIVSFGKEKNITHIFLAVSKIFNDGKVLSKFREKLKASKITLLVSSDFKSLGNITDNYYLSLVEQQICSSSKLFIASGDSTWSDYIRDYHREHKKKMDSGQKDTNYSYTEIITFEELLLKHRKPFTNWNKFHDTAKLNQRPRPKM
eukprot:TRINITY_DN4563_c0_g1_i4.p1 TRINITY_DN4563_c0_g1~~TRINITY_DN4563_c0_g1_i4.p1  ORF type:complete len:370 (+),score=53.72 TRINITY_DN4563_c0_g1_i4:306-1415(+)